MCRRFWPLLAVLIVLLAGCGGSAHKPAHVGVTSCPQAANGHGTPGACAPKRFGLTAPHTTTPGQPVFPDRSNNDPCYCGAQIKAAGQVGLIVKANQGTGFIDSTAVGMVASARAAGLTVGEYDFDQDYTVSEAQVFVARMHAAGIFPSTPNTFPATLDVEYGSFSRAGLLAQIAYLHAQGYRVQIYTGAWYWTPHAGCFWPAGAPAWLSGYPSAPVPCGTTGYSEHQYTSTPIDLSVFLGSLAQFHTFVNATPPGPTPKQIRHLIAQRNGALHAYRFAGCKTPVLTGPAVCHTDAAAVIAYQLKIPGTRPVCWGPHAQVSAPVCQIVRPMLSVWSRAATATYRAYNARGCLGPAEPVGINTPACNRLRQRASWFDRHAAALFKQWA